MPTLSDYTTSNILNSVSMYLAEYWLTRGVVMYWQDADALQIGTNGWYFQFSSNRASILADLTVASALASSRALLTVVSSYPTDPRFVQRLISDVTAGNPHEVAIPVMMLDLSAEYKPAQYEQGTLLQWRTRALMVEVVARNIHEQRWFADELRLVLKPTTVISVLNHDAGSLATVGDVNVLEPGVSTGTYLDAADARIHQVVSGSFIQYVA